MGFLQKLVDLVREELLDEPKKPQKAKKAGNSNSPKIEKPKGDSFEELCAKAKAGDLGAQYKLYMQFANKKEKHEALEALFTEMMNNGSVDGMGLLGCLLAMQPGFADDKVKYGSQLAFQAMTQGSIFPAVMRGYLCAEPIGLRRKWNPEITDNRLFICPVNYTEAIKLLEIAAEKLNSYPQDVQAVFSDVYGYLAYCYGYAGNEQKLYQYAFKGAEYENPIACIKMFEGYHWGDGEFEKNADFAIAYAKKVEKHKNQLLPALLARFYVGVGRIYFDAGVEDKAFEFNCRAAELGSCNAMSVISKWYEYGRVVDKDVEKALYWRNKATAAGYNWNTNKVPDGCI